MRPVVSGPIPTSPDPDDVQASTSFGTVSAIIVLCPVLILIFLPLQSWSSLVDPSALENMPDRERKRQESIFEFITTEQAYVQSLQLIIEVSNTMQERHPSFGVDLLLRQVFFTALQPVLAEKASQVVFANIEDILMFNTVSLVRGAL